MNIVKTSMTHHQLTSKQVLSLLINGTFKDNEAHVDGYKIVIDNSRIKVYSNRKGKQTFNEFYISEIIYFDGDDLDV
jgi:hypothetical protein